MLMPNLSIMRNSSGILMMPLCNGNFIYGVPHRYDDADLNDKKSFFDWQAPDLDLMPFVNDVTQFRDPKIYGGRRFWIISQL